MNSSLFFEIDGRPMTPINYALQEIDVKNIFRTMRDSGGGTALRFPLVGATQSVSPTHPFQQEYEAMPAFCGRFALPQRLH